MCISRITISFLSNEIEEESKFLTTLRIIAIIVGSAAIAFGGLIISKFQQLAKIDYRIGISITAGGTASILCAVFIIIKPKTP